MEEATYRVILKGLVQGVGFRHFAYTKAQSLNLKGYAKNLSTGEVEVIVQGNKDAVNQFIFSYLKSGPSEAQVRDMNVQEDKSSPDLPKFQVIH